MIKPEDISDDALNKMSREMWTDFHMDKIDAAKFLNAAIEAGLVSPPCHVIKTDRGYVHDPGYKRHIRVWAGKAFGPHVEHYIGQKTGLEVEE